MTENKKYVRGNKLCIVKGEKSFMTSEEVFNSLFDQKIFIKQSHSTLFLSKFLESFPKLVL